MATGWRLAARDGGHPWPEGIFLWGRDIWRPGTMLGKGVRPRGSMQKSWVTPWLLPQPCTLLTLDGRPWLPLPRG